jgi:acetylornithine deacetylase/succinyl-diaminopimelate desuccinylase-like protein
VILGPGPAALAHQTDEYCEIAAIEAHKQICLELIDRWAP